MLLVTTKKLVATRPPKAKLAEGVEIVVHVRVLMVALDTRELLVLLATSGVEAARIVTNWMKK